MTDTTHTTQYRSDIDGLRALAVFSVVVFHAFPNFLQGGFVGVDVFFVISGFLITSILIADMENGRFCFANFYARRIKRILPALLIVLIVCLLAGWVYLLTDEFKLLSKHVAAGSVFLSNYVYISESGYFDVAANKKVLLHLWSLGVEEQYYIVWPAIVWGCWRRGTLGLTIVLLMIISFLYNIYTINTFAPTSFYSSLSRTWELLIGGLLAYLHWKRSIRLGNQGQKADNCVQQVFYNCASIFGVLIVFHAVISLSSKSQFPGWLALEPALGTFLLLCAGPQAFVNRSILSNRILVWFGLISYPVYLWHWPLLVFAGNIEGEKLSASIRLVIILTSLVLAWLTYRIVEKPVRFENHGAGITFLLLTTLTCNWIIRSIQL